MGWDWSRPQLGRPRTWSVGYTDISNEWSHLWL